MELPNVRSSVDPEVSRLLSDAALYGDGARFVDGHFVITDEQYEALQQEQTTTQEIPFEVARSSAKPVIAARAILKHAYFVEKAEPIVAQLETTDPNTYLQGIRAYVRSVLIAPTDSEPFKYLYDKQQRIAPKHAADMQFLPLVIGTNLPPEIPKTSLISVVGQLARQLDRVFTMSSAIAKLTPAGESLALANKPQDFQDAVRDQFLAENIRLLELVVTTGSADKAEVAAQSNALFCNSISVLETALHDFPDVEPSKIVTAFMRQSVHFMDAVRRFQTRIEKQTAAAEEAEQARKLALRQKAQLAAQQKRAQKLYKEATRIRRCNFIFTVPPLGGEQLTLPDPEYIANSLFSGVASLEQSLGMLHGSSSWEAWQQLPKHNPVERFANYLLTVDAAVRSTIVALPPGQALQQMAKKIPQLATVRPEHAVRMNLVCTIDHPQNRQYFLIDIMYFATDAEDPEARRYRVVSSDLMNDKATLGRYLQRLRAYEGEAYAQTVQDALNAGRLQKRNAV